jgi:hypothetical protein
MGSILLILCVLLALKLATLVTSVSHAGDFLVLPRLVAGILALVLITWLIRD